MLEAEFTKRGGREVPKPAYAQSNTEGSADDSLSFIGSIREWHDGITGEWSKDNDIGRRRAEELRANIKMTGNYPALGQVVKMISENDSYGGVEVGFFHRLAELVAR